MIDLFAQVTSYIYIYIYIYSEEVYTIFKVFHFFAKNLRGSSTWSETATVVNVKEALKANSSFEFHDWDFKWIFCKPLFDMLLAFKNYFDWTDL